MQQIFNFIKIRDIKIANAQDYLQGINYYLDSFFSDAIWRLKSQRVKDKVPFKNANEDFTIFVQGAFLNVDLTNDKFAIGDLMNTLKMYLIHPRSKQILRSKFDKQYKED